MFDEPFELLVSCYTNQSITIKAYRTLITIVNKFFNEYFLELFRRLINVQGCSFKPVCDAQHRHYDKVMTQRYFWLIGCLLIALGSLYSFN